MISVKDFKSIINLSLVGIIIFGGHYGLLELFPHSLYAPKILQIHPFLLIITLLSVVSVKIIIKKVRDNIMGYVFMASGLIKMLFAIIYLIPTLSHDSLFRKEYIIQFFLIYFIYLAIEVYYLLKEFKAEDS